MCFYTDINAYFPSIDYTLPIRDVFINSVKACVLVQGFAARLEFLRQARYMPEGIEGRLSSKVVTEGIRWPSWVPNWTVAIEPSSQRRVTYKSDNQRVSGFRESKANVLETQEYQSHYQDRGPCLSVRGLRILTIETITKEFSATCLSKCNETYTNTKLTYVDAFEMILECVTWQSKMTLSESRPPSEFWEFDNSFDSIEAQNQRAIVERVTSKVERTKQEEATAIDSAFRVFITSTGYIGKVARGIQEGDEIAIVFCTPWPLIVRSEPDDVHYLLIVGCYVPGLMEGEVVEDLDEFLIENTCFR